MAESLSAAAVSVEDAIVQMKQGSTMLKCGRTGSPHFRSFTLSDDLETLRWASPKKKSTESTGECTLATPFLFNLYHH